MNSFPKRFAVMLSVHHGCLTFDYILVFVGNDPLGEKIPSLLFSCFEATARVALRKIFT